MKYYIPFCILIFLMAGAACHHVGPENDGEGGGIIRTPVSITHADTLPLEETLTLQAVSTFLLATDVKSNINGYIVRSDSHFGQKVSQGQVLFVLQTKEARSLGNIVNSLDTTFKFYGISTIKSPVTGYLTMLNHQSGDYVQDGEILARVARESSFGFMLNLPYEYQELLRHMKDISIRLPDSTLLWGVVSQIMPQMDSTSQTQQVFIHVHPDHTIPAGLIAQAILIKRKSTHPSLPKAAILSDEGQQHFWVMRLLNDTTAVKIPVQKGVENDAKVEIVFPALKPSDTFILQGGYGLPDTAMISIQN